MSKGRLLTTHPVKTSSRKENIEIRIDPHTGIFSADVDGHLLTDSDLSNLRQRIEFQAKHTDNDLIPLIVIKYDANGFWGGHQWGVESWFNCKIDLVLATKKDSNDLFSYIEASLAGDEVSMRGAVPYRLPRDHWNEFRDQYIVIEYTPQRYASITNLINRISGAIDGFTEVISIGSRSSTIEQRLDKQIKLLPEGDNTDHN